MISPVKKVAVTLLIALYTIMLMWSTVDRTYNWAAKQSETKSSRDSEDSAGIGKPRPVSPPHQVYRRILANPFVVEPPVLAAWIVLTPQRLYPSTELLVIGEYARRQSGRAPPRFL